MLRWIPTAWRARRLPRTGAELLGAIAILSVAGAPVVALAAPHVSVPGELPLWDTMLLGAVLVGLVSILLYPDDWSWSGRWDFNGRCHAAARTRGANRAVGQDRKPVLLAGRRGGGPGVHRTVRQPSRGPLAGADRPTHASSARPPSARRRHDSLPRLQRQHGRPRR